MKIVIAGGTGLVGSATRKVLEAEGHAVAVLTRNPRREGEHRWDPTRGDLPLSVIDGADAVINLSGENVAQGRWTKALKARLRDSRILGTRLLVDACAKVSAPPKVFINASAAGIYAPHIPEGATEDAPHGTGFLAELCVQWEAEARKAEAHTRLVLLRIGVVLAPAGGALAKMVPVFKAGLGGPVGGGQQRISWIHVEDLARVIATAIYDDRYAGPVNCVAPGFVTNREFSKALGRALHRPAVTPTPALAVKALFGEMGRETVLADMAVAPRRLSEWGFAFKHADLEKALADLLD